MLNAIPSGAMPVLLTPFTDDDQVDFGALDELINFYSNKAVTGLFICCLSGEVFHLSEQENLEIAHQVVKHVGNRMAVVTGANFGSTLKEQAQSLDRFHLAGVDASVIILSGLPSNEDLLEQVLCLAEMTSAPLGLYECPYPQHWLLNASEVKQIARTGRFIFMKETSRDVATHIDKLQAAADTPLRIFQANLRCTPDTLRAGTFGHCGVIANVCPELCAAYCDSSLEDDELKQRLYVSMQVFHDMMIAHGYPTSAKYILGRRGLRIGTATRSITKGAFTPDDAQAIDACLALFKFDRPLDATELETFKQCAARVSPASRTCLNTAD